MAPDGDARLIAALLAWRWYALALVVLVTVVLGAHALSLRVDPGVEAMIPTGTGDLERLGAFHARFGTDEVVVIALHGEGLFSREGLDRLDQLTRRLAALPHVGRVLSPTNVMDLDGDELGPVAFAPYARVRAGTLEPEAMGRGLGAHPLYGGLLVAPDARTAAVLVDLALPPDGTDLRPGVVASLRQAAGKTRGVAAFVAGMPVEKVDVATYVARDQRIFIPLVFLLLAGCTALLYRHPVGVLVPLTVVSVALVWTLGLFALAGRTLNPVTSLMTPVVLVMSLEGTIQLLNQYLAARARGVALAAALIEAYRRMRVPGFNAAFTTAVGFVALLTLPIPAIRDFGLFAALGVMLAYGLTLTLTPLLLATLPDVPLRVIRAFESGPIERGLVAVVRRVCRHPGLTAALVLATLGLSVVGIMRIRIETDLVASLRHASPLATASRFIDTHLTGVNSVEIVIPGIAGTDLDGLVRVARFEGALRALPAVRKVAGLPDLVARVNRALHRGDDAFARIPDGPEAADDLHDILATLTREAPADLRRFLAEGGPSERPAVRVVARVPALDSQASQALFGDIREAARHAGLGEVELTGNFVVFSNMATTLVRNQVKGLLPALAVILLAMAVQFRSLRLGLLCAIPNSVPVLVVYGLMGFAGVALSVPTAMIASVAIGTIVDNSIYLLARFREAFARVSDYPEALASMVRAAGRAVVFSTVTLAAGFWVSATSSFLPSVHFGFLTGAAFLLGLVSQFVVLPLALVLLRPLGRGTPRRPPAAAGLTALGALGIGLLLLLGGGVAEAQSVARDTVLTDQFGRPDGPGRHLGRTILLLYGTPDGLRRMKTWEERLLDKSGDTPVVLRGLDARAARGRRTEAEVRERLQQNVPREIAILVDWDGDLARTYSLPDTEVSVTVVDADGKACRTAAGAVTPPALAEMRETLAHAWATGRCP